MLTQTTYSTGFVTPTSAYAHAASTATDQHFYFYRYCCYLTMTTRAGIEALENLQQHDDNTVYSKALDVITKYFAGEEEEGENACAPASNGNSYVFGAPQQLQFPACGGNTTSASAAGGAASGAAAQPFGSSGFNFAPAFNFSS
jgi:Atypical Arm repeat